MGKWICYKYKGYWIRRHYVWENYWTVERDCKILAWKESEQECKDWIVKRGGDSNADVNNRV